MAIALRNTEKIYDGAIIADDLA